MSNTKKEEPTKENKDKDKEKTEDRCPNCGKVGVNCGLNLLQCPNLVLIG